MKQVDTNYWRIRTELKAVLNAPLPGGRGFQGKQDAKVHQLARQLLEYELPPR